MATTLAFTPGSALLGGLLLGIAAAAKLVIAGRVLGVSGAVKGLVTGKFDAWRFAFLIGMLAAGGVWYVPSVPFSTDATFVSVPRAAGAGLLTGWGTACGNGCTSGHGICGNARLSRRSIVATAIFMGFGMVTATFSKLNEALNVDESESTIHNVQWPSDKQLIASCSAVGASIVVLWIIHECARRTVRTGLEDPNIVRVVDIVATIIIGFIFGIGLLVSGMVLPTKVSGFLSIGKAWDPTLALVMGGALVVMIPVYHYFVRQRGEYQPTVGRVYEPPGQGVIDLRLILGAATFGIGWGLAGSCPGPVFVYLGGHPWEYSPLAWMASFFLGQWLHGGILGTWLLAKFSPAIRIESDQSPIVSSSFNV